MASGAEAPPATTKDSVTLYNFFWVHGARGDSPRLHVVSLSVPGQGPHEGDGKPRLQSSTDDWPVKDSGVIHSGSHTFDNTIPDTFFATLAYDGDTRVVDGGELVDFELRREVWVTTQARVPQSAWRIKRNRYRGFCWNLFPTHGFLILANWKVYPSMQDPAFQADFASAPPPEPRSRPHEAGVPWTRLVDL